METTFKRKDLFWLMVSAALLWKFKVLNAPKFWTVLRAEMTSWVENSIPQPQERHKCWTRLFWHYICKGYVNHNAISCLKLDPRPRISLYLISYISYSIILIPYIICIIYFKYICKYTKFNTINNIHNIFGPSKSDKDSTVGWSQT